ncbi:hypothetical protein [Cognatiyoonia sp. IB215182]|uniref:hypothetical protein n=1 Tax=Cognatiyoonia sp. IB215182 TaxID=3097353 RepID=UPI002A23F4E1|nr:hypothetical protein [Cognatiyoonia sp. IB215182]
MFRKADGTTVWLRTASFTPYFKIEGHIECESNFNLDTVLRRLEHRFKPMTGICDGFCFMIGEFGDAGGVLFCIQPDMRCAVILIGQKQDARGRFPEAQENKRLVGLDEHLKTVTEGNGFKINVASIGSELSAID